ncbi:unnamed protein product [Cuscuta epithymum]|uniref:Uncharacterized protein n=1 Tax=Cuscuta epithymum TaxID=186058 RepID=A0AAV0DPL7_9ASTE|nr:unnamed protein product [Cuscuta epithymum]
MVMDRDLRGSHQTTSRIELQDEMVKLYLDQEAIRGLTANDTYSDPNSVAESEKYGDLSNSLDPNLLNKQNLSCLTFPTSPYINPINGLNSGNGHEDCDFSDTVLKYISQMLMEEDIEEKACMFQESAALQAAERSFYEVIGEKYPPSSHLADHMGHDSNNGGGDSDLLNPNWDIHDSLSSLSSSCNSLWTVHEGLADSPVSTLQISSIPSNIVQEANKFFKKGQNGNKNDMRGLKGKKNVHYALEEAENVNEGRSSKQSAVSFESTVEPQMFDEILLCSGGKNESDLRQSWKSVQECNGKKSRGSKKNGIKRDNMVDLSTLLTHCAQAVASDDSRTAVELLKQIRKHSSQTGDGAQRIAHYFADGLEARMAGSGTKIYKALITMPTSASDVLKAYQLFLAACPFRKISNFFSNHTIMNLIAQQDTTSVHIIDFGIFYGFQWPCFIQRLSRIPGGPPKLRITGIDFPQPGFRPAERVEETGRRLANYSQRFNVPFEFHAIAQKWETIKPEDLKIKEGELLAVNCLYRLRNLLDETVVLNSPRDTVLDLIRRLNPAVFIMGAINGLYNAPFFITRFREALFHYSSLFDMLEATTPREVPERVLLEKVLFGREAMNVIACEGGERIERPETYKQWQVRIQRAGFRPLPVNEEIMKTSKERVKVYHKDFMIDVNGAWLVQGWKGRILFALSSWKAGP